MVSVPSAVGEFQLGSPNTELLEITQPILLFDDELQKTIRHGQAKFDLREKIRKRRQSEGLEDIEVKFEKPKEYEMRPEEIEKRESRKARNRKSAHESRVKRKQQEQELEETITSLEKENQKWKNYVTNLQNFEQKLRLRFADHLIRCKSAEVKRLQQDAKRQTSDTVSVSGNIN
ncbi:protein c-Fos-like [Ylistrum balloti]|uniref:protein c-Fos-like n=1 Tax=Ylistrum balloti TaxID=509963 RepID=UPI002905B446|nr:protein c-Fos-like [Ylistrum balloti]